MSNILMWKLLIELLLGGAILHLCMRLPKSPNLDAQSRRLAELDGILRGLIQEAEGISNGLNDSLRKRQGELEKLLFTLESVESRVTKAIKAAEELKSSKENQLQSSKLTEKIEVISEPEPVAKKIEEEDQANWDGLNIYGEPVGQTKPEKTTKAQATKQAVAKGYNQQPATPKKRTLANSLEMTVEDPASKKSTDSVSPDLAIQEVLARAEELLKAGANLQSVAKETDLPLDDVRMLSQMLIQEKNMQSSVKATSGDPRLGVLGPRKRSSAVV